MSEDQEKKEKRRKKRNMLQWMGILFVHPLLPCVQALFWIQWLRAMDGWDAGVLCCLYACVWLPLNGIWLRERWKRGEREKEVDRRQRTEEGGMD